MKKVRKTVSASILSMSLLTVMAGAAVAPALGIIREHFSNASGLLVQLIISLPGLIAVLMVCLFMPNDRLGRHEDTAQNHVNWAAGKEGTHTMGIGERLRKFHPSIVGMFLCMSLFFVYPSNFAIACHAQTSLSQNAVTLIMVGLDVVAFFIGLAFSFLMRHLRVGMKFIAPAGFIVGYAVLAAWHGVTTLLLGSFLIGIANGVGVPYLNTIASIKGGKDAVTTVMPLISASFYLGQFLSPIYVSGLGAALFSSNPAVSVSGPYILAVIVGVLYLLQVILTRNFQSLPPEEAGR